MSYREAALSCPACAEPLDATDVGGATIDVCAKCGGVWVDWFDGELIAIVRSAPRPEGAGLAPEASGGCPRCRAPLAAERFFDSQAEVLRCAECAGAFVSQDAARAIAHLDPEQKRPRPADDAWSRLAATLQRWFGWDEPPH